MNKYHVEFLDESVKFIESLPVKLRAKVFRTIELLMEFGYELSMPFSRKIYGTKDLYELRVKQGSNICRLFYFYWKDKTYIILSGYVKKQKKTDKKEIEKAISLMKRIKKERI